MMSFPHLLFLLACLCLVSSTPVELRSNEEGFNDLRVQDWFEAETQDEGNTELQDLRLGVQTDFDDAFEDEDDDTETLRQKLYQFVQDAFWRVLWMSVGWAIGMAAPVGLLAAAIAYSKYHRRKAQKIQDQILNEQLRIQQRQTVDTPSSSVASNWRQHTAHRRSEITPAAPF